jgi:hypothetical protein
MSNYSTKKWDMRNVWPLPSGKLAVRPTLEEITQFGAAPNNFVAAFSVRNARTNSVFHYHINSSAPYVLTVADENLVVQQTYNLGTNKEPRAVSWGIVEDELMISSPDFPTIWGVVGGVLVKAETVPSVNPSTTAVPVIPVGIGVSWAGRYVISDGEFVWFSDGLAPRTYVAANAVNPPGGAIFGLHVNAGGALIICTTEGVYALPEDAAASDTNIVLGVFSKLTDHSTLAYNTSCSSNGRVFGLTVAGYKLIDEQNGREVFLSEDSISRNPGRITFNDYRNGRIYGANAGPIVTIGPYMNFTHLQKDMKSWFHHNSTQQAVYGGFSLVGILVDHDGTEMYVCKTAAYRFNGNQESEDSLSPAPVYGYIAGRLRTPPEASPVIRHVTFATDSDEPFKVFIHTVEKTISPKQYSPVIGTDSWGNTVKYREHVRQSRELSFAIRGDDVMFQLGVKGYPSEMPEVVDVVFKGPGRKRPTN